MVKRTNPQIQATELKFIAEDADDVVRLMLGLGRGGTHGMLFLIALPIVGLFAEESFNYLRAVHRSPLAENINNELFDEFGRVVTKIRARIKLMDDTDGGMIGLVDYMDLVRKRSKVLFKHPSNKFIQLLSGPFRPDLGIFFVNDRIIATTHVAIPAFGFSREQIQAFRPGGFNALNSFTYEFAGAAGKYLALVAAIMLPLGNSVCLDPPALQTDIKVTNLDFIGNRFYKHREKAVVPSESCSVAALTLLLSQTNSACFLLPTILGTGSNLLMRVQFLTAYHASRTLRHVLCEIPSWLKEDAEPALEHRALRNTMAHYGLRGVAEYVVDTGTPFDAVIHSVSGINREQLADLVFKRLECISELLQPGLSKTELYPKGAFLGDHT